ncbi:MAG: RHS repeat-associated core domain-containing protein [Candidatus Electrothrix sp. YB6]
MAGLTKQNGNAVHTYRYDPYSGVIPANGNFTDPHNHYTLTGKEFDENTGLVWFGARHYDPETGVWMGQDTYRGRLNDPASLHRFMYVGDNPVTFWDWYGYAYFATRPLDGWLGKLYNTQDLTVGSIDDQYNTVIAHEHIFFEDGSNVGFFDDGEVHYNNENRGDYDVSQTGYDDALLRQAVDNVEPNDYYALYKISWSKEKYNCQDWAEDVRREYERLLEEQRQREMQERANVCMANPIKQSDQTEYWQGYFQGQSVDPTYLFTGY